MDTYTARKIVSLSALAVAFIGAGFSTGCAHNELPPISANDYFQADDTPRAVDNVMAQQQANGAREDGTFYPQHFTNGQLNSLGYAKLSAIFYGKQDGKYALFLDVPKGDGYTAAQDSLAKALARGGVKEEDYTITAGPNLGISAPAAQGLTALARQHGGSSDSSSSPDVGTINPTGK